MNYKKVFKTGKYKVNKSMVQYGLHPEVPVIVKDVKVGDSYIEVVTETSNGIAGRRLVITVEEFMNGFTKFDS